MQQRLGNLLIIRGTVNQIFKSFGVDIEKAENLKKVQKEKQFQEKKIKKPRKTSKN